MDPINAQSGSLQGEMTGSIMKKSMQFQANMINKLLSSGTESADAMRSNALSQQGIGQHLNISA